MSRRTVMIGVLAVAVSVAGAGPAAAQTALTFMHVPDIPGDSTNDAHKTWIDIASLTQSFDTQNKNNTACTVRATKGFDSAGPRLWAAAVSNQVFTEIQFDVVKAGDKQHRFYELRLQNARILSVTSTPSDFTESLVIGADTASLKFFPQNPDGSEGNPVTSVVSCK
jgi:type VI protein secretion system component Hcp